MSFEDEYTKQTEKKNPLTAFLPILGLLLAVAFGAIAFIVSEPVQDLLAENISGFPREQEAQYVVAVVIFISLVLIGGAIYATLAPKPPKLVSERELKKEREQREQEIRDRKRRQRKVQEQMAEERRKSKQ
jgi:predicted outer membrane lipoprotein